MKVIRFTTAEDYLRERHPGYTFVFHVEHNALNHWSYSPDSARAVQNKMLEVVCQSARKIDAEKGLKVVIEEEDVRVRAAAASD